MSHFRLTDINNIYKINVQYKKRLKSHPYHLEMTITRKMRPINVLKGFRKVKKKKKPSEACLRNSHKKMKKKNHIN